MDSSDCRRRHFKIIIFDMQLACIGPARVRGVTKRTYMSFCSITRRGIEQILPDFSAESQRKRQIPSQLLFPLQGRLTVLLQLPLEQFIVYFSFISRFLRV